MVGFANVARNQGMLSQQICVKNVKVENDEAKLKRKSIESDVASNDVTAAVAQ